MLVPLPSWIAPSGHDGQCACDKCADLRVKLQEYVDVAPRKTKRYAGPPYVWGGQCLKCGECYEKETQEDKPPFHDEDGQPIGVMCPGCRKRGLTMVGVVHFTKHIEDFVPEDVRGDRERFGNL